MSLFKPKRDPIAVRKKTVEARLAAIKKQITEEKGAGSRPRATPPVHGPAAPTNSAPFRTRERRTAERVAAGPIFEPLDPKRLRPDRVPETTPAHYNELGVRKYDVTALWRRFLDLFRESAPSNPRLVNYLAAGSVHGLRAMRYEKRIARRRFVVFFVVLLLVLIGIAGALLRKY